MQQEYDETNAKLEQISKAAKGESKEAPVLSGPSDIFSVLANVEHLHKCAVEQLTPEGAGKLKSIMEAFSNFTKEVPEFFPANLPVDQDMFDDDSYLPEELEQATEAGADAAAKTGLFSRTLASPTAELR